MTTTATDRAEYARFLETKAQLGGEHGFEPVWLPDCLFGFQRHLCEWAVRKGRAAILADCGLGKSLMELVFAENVVRKANARALILTPLAVAPQFVAEGEKFGVGVAHSRDGKVGGPGVYVTNIQRLHLFDRHDFACVIVDESSSLKDFDGKQKAAVTEFMREAPYRGLYTATAAPNDFDELGTSSEALGELGYHDMLSKFFKKATSSGLGWNRLNYRLRTYAERDFWRWVCSWSRACRRPSDLGFPDDGFALPPLACREHVVDAATPPPNSLFDAGARNLVEQRAEQRRTLAERCEKVAELVGDTRRPAVCWVHLNDESALVGRLVPDAVQVTGSDPDEEKEEKLAAFCSGGVRVLVTKPTIAGYGLNWQHCAHQTYFPSHSFEQWYQGVRRCWRFGQTRPVTVDVVTTDGAAGVLANLRRKQQQAEQMFARLVELMGDGLRIDRGVYGDKKEEVPSWLSSTSA